MSDISRPIIRLRPKKSPKRFRFGAPWVYSDEVVLDRRSRALAPGTIVTLEDADRVPFAVGAFHPESRIAARILSLDHEEVVDRAWLVTRITHALALRSQLFDEPYYRLIHAEADGLPGVIVDRFGDTLVVQPNAAWSELLLDDLGSALVEVTGAAAVIKNAGGRARVLEGLDTESAVLLGTVEGAIETPMNGATYLADLVDGQKTGLFFDQRDNQAFAARLARGGSVLDVFSHVGGFALASLDGGATRALAVDASAPALELARQGAAASGVADRFETRQGDAVKVMQELLAEDASFDCVICDPPAFAPRKDAVKAGLRGYERVAQNAARLVSNGGYLVLCSCSGSVDMAAFKAACVTGIGRGGRSAQILHEGAAAPDHPVHPYLDESAYLKALFFRLN